MLSRTNTINGETIISEGSNSSDFLNNYESIRSNYSIDSDILLKEELKHNKITDNISDNYINENVNKSDDSKDLHARLLSQDNNDNILDTYIFYLIAVISILIIAGTIIFAIYSFTNGKGLLFNISVIFYVIALCIFCCLCSCIAYKCEVEKLIYRG